MTDHTAALPGDLADRIADVLRDRYRLSPERMLRLPIGQGTVNYRAICPDQEFFVKIYPRDADLDAERQAIDLSNLARRHGVPTAAIVPNRDGAFLDATSTDAISVWGWVPGHIMLGALSDAQCHAAGAAMGRMHQVFAPLPAGAGLASQAEDWLAIDLPALHATVDQLLDLVERRIADTGGDVFDQQARRTLTERRQMLDHLPGLVADLPKLSTQVLHGDYSPVNLLFDGDRLAAVTDFRPPEPFLLAFEVGRVAFYPTTVTTTSWQSSAQTLIGAYLDANPTASADDLRACARIALIQLIRSLYGVKQHYLKPGLFQHDLDTFWTQRHQAAQVLLDHLAVTDALLRDLT